MEIVGNSSGGSPSPHWGILEWDANEWNNGFKKRAGICWIVLKKPNVREESIWHLHPMSSLLVQWYTLSVLHSQLWELYAKLFFSFSNTSRPNLLYEPGCVQCDLFSGVWAALWLCRQKLPALAPDHLQTPALWQQPLGSGEQMLQNHCILLHSRLFPVSS